MKTHTKWYLNEKSMPVALYEADDILKLVNLAGADGWEITGGIGLGNSEPGVHETRWRIMRREI